VTSAGRQDGCGARAKEDRKAEAGTIPSRISDRHPPEAADEKTWR
jgi:hypothetical protein